MQGTLQFLNVHKSYRTYAGRKHVLRGVNFTLPPDVSLGILGRNGAGKSTLINILSGIDIPDSGVVRKNGVNLSWPIGRGGVHGLLTGRDNVRFVCRLYGLDIPETTAFVQDFTELGEYFDMPVGSYSSGMKARLAFAISMAARYDCYLVDEGFNAGDARFEKRMGALFDERRKNANMIVVSHSMHVIKRFCNKAAVLDKGVLTVYDSLDEAIHIYNNL